MKDLKAFPPSVAIGFFLIGLISAVAFRAIIIVQHTNPSYVRLMWYIAVIANFIFFLYRYYISLKRKNALKSRDLIQKLQANHPLDESDRNVISYLLTSIERSRENLNYLSIFVLSAIAVIIDIIMTLRK